MLTRRSRTYLKTGRLPDVLALIQVLALDEHSHRSEPGLEGELQGPPSSSDTWISIAREHPEFFRVRQSGEHVVSLTARHVMPKDESGRRPMSSEFTYKLLQTAIELHDRQVRRADRWIYLIPIAAALVAGILGLLK